MRSNCNTFQLWRCQSKQISCKIVIAYDRQLTNISPTIFNLAFCVCVCLFLLFTRQKPYGKFSEKKVFFFFLFSINNNSNNNKIKYLNHFPSMCSHIHFERRMDQSAESSRTKRRKMKNKNSVKNAVRWQWSAKSIKFMQRQPRNVKQLAGNNLAGCVWHPNMSTLVNRF